MNIQETKAMLTCMVLTSMLIFSASGYAEINQETTIVAWLFDEDGGDTVED